MPAGTLYPKGGAICSKVKGAFFNPCFNLDKTSDKQLPRRDLGLRLCVLRFHARGGRAEMIAGVGRASATDVGDRALSIRRGRKRRPTLDPAPMAKPAATRNDRCEPRRSRRRRSR